MVLQPSNKVAANADNNNMNSQCHYLHKAYLCIIFNICLYGIVESVQYADNPFAPLLLGANRNNAGHISKKDFSDYRKAMNTKPEESWTGRWLPERITERPDVQQQAPQAPQSNSMWQMINSTCDDGKTNLTVDWDGDPVNYTCYNPRNYFEPNYDLPNLIIKSAIPKGYKAMHACMNKKLEYPTDLPTFGTHRPAWPRYGEYKFLPKQRWLHSLEHGAVVMLYHPCAHPVFVNELKEMVASCLYRHIITPYTLLPPERPMALLTWGWALMLTAPDKHGVRNFIKEHALHGPEATSKDGQFSEGLITPAKIITDVNDASELGLCPQTLF